MRPCYVISVVKVTGKHSITYPKCKGAFSTAVVYEPHRTLQATSKNQVKNHPFLDCYKTKWKLFFHYYSNCFNKASPVFPRGSIGRIWVKFNFVRKVNKKEISTKSYSSVLWEITFQCLTLLKNALDRQFGKLLIWRDPFGPWNHFFYL